MSEPKQICGLKTPEEEGYLLRGKQLVLPGRESETEAQDKN